MIIWLNGAYGAGKTTIAELLHEKIESSWIYDPEQIGEFFQANLPQEIQEDDFQQYPEWRIWNVRMLEKLDKEYQGLVIVPMTLYREGYFKEIIKTLENKRVVVHHFLLEVSSKGLKERLNLRSNRVREWCLSHLEAELDFFEGLPSSQKIDNEHQEKEVVVQKILKKIGVKI